MCRGIAQRTAANTLHPLCTRLLVPIIRLGLYRQYTTHTPAMYRRTTGHRITDLPCLTVVLYISCNKCFSSPQQHSVFLILLRYSLIVVCSSSYPCRCRDLLFKDVCPSGLRIFHALKPDHLQSMPRMINHNLSKMPRNY